MNTARRILTPVLLTAAVVMAPATAAQAIPNPEPVEECEGPAMEWYGGSCERRHSIEDGQQTRADNIVKLLFKALGTSSASKVAEARW